VELRIVTDQDFGPGTDRLTEAQRLVRAVRERLAILADRLGDIRQALASSRGQTHPGPSPTAESSSDRLSSPQVDESTGPGTGSDKPSGNVP